MIQKILSQQTAAVSVTDETVTQTEINRPELSITIFYLELIFI